MTAYAYYINKRVNLITGTEEKYNVRDWLKKQEDYLLLEDEDGHRILHCFYELGHIIENQETFLKESDLLLIDLTYAKKEKRKELAKFNAISLKAKSSPSLNKYSAAFNTGYEHLLNGDCYQFNLTYPFTYSFNENVKVEDFLGNLWKQKDKRGAYAHSTYIPLWDKLYLSNSPECLFQATRHPNGTHLWTMPIKGSLKYAGKKEFSKKWKELIDCKKNEAELFMITDLLRNDLSKIESPTSKVVAKKLPLTVPGILHQYSLIDIILSPRVNFLDLLVALFPGGSITGAPKKNVMKILNNIESNKRKFYCGSTIVWDQEILASSINIRSSIIDFNKREMTYNAGGGITLKSSMQDEFQEMKLKVSSFIDLFS
jgi:anthranilate/para-aminobenzoate synthase component I